MKRIRWGVWQPWECDRCDGCGWYEGGKTLQTHCEVCDGTGVVMQHRKTLAQRKATPDQLKRIARQMRAAPR